MSETVPERTGNPWYESDYAVLVELLGDELTVDEIAPQMGRTANAIKGRLKYLVPFGHEQRKRADYDVWVRENRHIWQPIWPDTVRARHAEQGQAFWTEHDLGEIRDAWRHCTPLPTLARRLEVSEVNLARQIVVLGLADNRRQIIDRLGATPGGPLDAAARNDADHAANAVWVLVIDGLTGKPHSSITVHATAADAVTERDAAFDRHARDRPGMHTVHWTLAQRSVDVHNFGETRRDTVLIGTADD